MDNIEVMQERLEDTIANNSISPLLSLPFELLSNIFLFLPIKDLTKTRRVCIVFNLLALYRIDWKNIIKTNIREIEGLKKVEEIHLFDKSIYKMSVIERLDYRFRHLRLEASTKQQENLSYYKYFRDNFLKIKDIERRLGIKRDEGIFAKTVEYLSSGGRPSAEKIHSVLQGLKLAAEGGYSRVIAKFSGDGFHKLAAYLHVDKNLCFNYFHYSDQNNKDNILLAATRSGNPACLTLIFSILNTYFSEDNTEAFFNYIQMAYKYALENALPEMIEVYLIYYPSLFNYNDVLLFSADPQKHIFARTILKTISKKSNPKVISETLNRALKNDHEKLVIFLISEYPEEKPFLEIFLFAIKNRKGKILVLLSQHPQCLAFSENEKYSLLVEAIKIKDINYVRFLLGKFNYDLNIPFDNISLMNIAVLHSSSEVILQLIISGANYDLPHLLLCLVQENYDNAKDLEEAKQKAVYLIKNNGVLVTKGEHSALCEAVEKMNLDFILLFTSHKRKLNMISFDEAKCALGLAKDLAKDMSSPNFRILNRIVLELTSFISAKVNRAPHSELFGDKGIDRIENNSAKVVNEPPAPNLKP